MQLSNPLMDAMAARTIRSQLDNRNKGFKPIDMRMKLHKDGIQLKPHDFFSVFKEQYFRSRKID